MTKPCNPEELIARIKANLRRDKTSLHEVNNIYKYKDIEYDLDKNVVRRNNQIIDITKKERLILRLLMSTP
jgi:DNA-binding response OmpR family regulator